jgi:hypothetical protein
MLPQQLAKHSDLIIDEKCSLVGGPFYDQSAIMEPQCAYEAGDCYGVVHRM